MTFLQAQRENIRIKKGAEAMPVIYWDLNVRTPTASACLGV
jgi:hypothetical protein